MYSINHDTKRISADDHYSWEYLKGSRAQAYLFKEFNDVNLKHDYIPLMGGELVEQILSFFHLGSQLIYPAKSYFVAITYASIISHYTFDDDFWEILSKKDLLIDDKYFKPYGVDSETDLVYEHVIVKLLEFTSKRNNHLIYFNRPESELWKHFPSCSATLEYFFEEFLFSDEDKNVLKSQTFYDWEELG